MPVTIGEIVTETVLAPEAAPAGASPTGASELSAEEVDRIVERACERVLEMLRREWDR